MSLANPSLAGGSRGGDKYAGVWFETSVRWRGEDPDRGARRRGVRKFALGKEQAGHRLEAAEVAFKVRLGAE